MVPVPDVLVLLCLYYKKRPALLHILFEVSSQMCDRYLQYNDLDALEWSARATLYSEIKIAYK